MRELTPYQKHIAKNFWLSWYHPRSGWASFALDWPWWLKQGDKYPIAMICSGAVKAESVEVAKKIVESGYEALMVTLEWRFCEERPRQWHPFNVRFLPTAAMLKKWHDYPISWNCWCKDIEELNV